MPEQAAHEFGNSRRDPHMLAGEYASVQDQDAYDSSWDGGFSRNMTDFDVDDSKLPGATTQHWTPPSGDDNKSLAGVKYDIGNGTRLACIAGLCVGGVLSLLCIGGGIYIICAYKERLAAPSNLSTVSLEILAFITNVIITLCLDGIMFVHSVSLRWALYKENRLEFNTNLRLFTNAKKSGPNRWYVNAFALICLVLSYAATSYLFIPDATDFAFDDYYSDDTTTRINGVALLALGIGILGQTLVSGWCLLSFTGAVLTWSSNPLNSALVALQNGYVERQPGRCMMTVHQREENDIHHQGQKPLPKQGSILEVHRNVRYIIGLLWALAFVAAAWMIVIALVTRGFSRSDDSTCWQFNFSWSSNSDMCNWNIVALSMSPAANIHNPKAGQFSYNTEVFLGLLFLCGIQAAQTIALHCTELLVNISRDETSWRNAYVMPERKHSGNIIVGSPMWAAALSWENAILFVAKALLHWCVGQALKPTITFEDTGAEFHPSDTAHTDDPGSITSSQPVGIEFEMIYSRLMIYAILAILLACFTTFLGLRRRKGCQPASMGHLQTIVDLVDDWTTDEKGKLWWGDKTLENDTSFGQIRHAGTSCFKDALGSISMTSKYAGIRLKAE